MCLRWHSGNKSLDESRLRVLVGFRECCRKARVIISWLGDLVTELIHTDESYQTEDFSLLGQCLHLGWRSSTTVFI